MCPALDACPMDIAGDVIVKSANMNFNETLLGDIDDLVTLLNNPLHDTFINPNLETPEFNISRVAMPDLEHSYANLNGPNSDKVLSVLGVDLDLYFSNGPTDAADASCDDIDRLLDKNLPLKNFERIEDFFDETFDCDFFGEDAMTPGDADASVQLIDVFPHIADENNKRRRSLLFERSCSRKERDEECTIRPVRSYHCRSQHALLNHDYARKKLDDDQKHFPCPVENCAKTYAKASHLKAHLRRHSGEKPFVCNWQDCAWRFSRSDELARHKRSHSGIKPYKCEICDKAFARSDHLAKHNKVHRKRMAHFGSYGVKKRLRANNRGQANS